MVHATVSLAAVNILSESVNDSSLVQIVRRHFELHPVAVREADEMLAHLARNMGENLMLIRQLNPEHRSSEDGSNFTLGFDCLFCRHDLKNNYWETGPQNGANSHASEAPDDGTPTRRHRRVNERQL